MNPLHLHLILNHFPLAGILIGFILLEWSLYCRNNSLQKTSLLVLLGSAVLTFAVFWSGERAEEFAPRILDIPHALLNAHEEAAEAALWAVGALAIVSGWALWISRDERFPKPRILALAGLLALIAIGLIGRASYRGGQIRHAEIQ